MPAFHLWIPAFAGMLEFGPLAQFESPRSDLSLTTTHEEVLSDRPVNKATGSGPHLAASRLSDSRLKEIYPQMTQMTQMQEDRDPRTYAIIGAAIEAHRHLGHGFLEAVYQDALAIELDARAVPYEIQVELPIFYKGRPLRSFYRADFICFDNVIVEIKALRALTGCEEAQIINYLKASRLTTGLLLNFGSPWLEHKRFVYSASASSV